MTDGLYPALRTPPCGLLDCDVPILLAGMGGVSRWELAAAVANAGGYPTLGMVREAPDLIEREVRALRAATDRLFAVNLIPAATAPDLLDAQIACCLDLGVGAFSFFWDVIPQTVERVKAAGYLVLHQVGTLQAAHDAEAAGADVLIAQGIEAGGHVHGRTGAFALTAEILAETRLPVVVSGGIVDGRGLAAALAMGAAGMHCGTAFIATTESFAHDEHKRRLVVAHASDTVLTDIFVLNWPRGAAVRVLANSVTEALGTTGFLATTPTPCHARPSPGTVAWRACGSARIRPCVRRRVTSRRWRFYAGQGVGRITDVAPAGDRLRRMADEAAALLARFIAEGAERSEASHGGE